MIDNVIDVFFALVPLLIVGGAIFQPRMHVFEIPMLFFANMLIWYSTLGIILSQLSLLGISRNGVILSPWLSIPIILGAPFLMWLGWELTTYSAGCFTGGFSNAIRFPFIGFAWEDKLLWPYKEYEYHETYP